MHYYKAVGQDGTDFRTGTVRWIPEDGVLPAGGWLVEHPNPGLVGSESPVGCLAVSTLPTDCTGMSWPCRLLRVKPVDVVWTPEPRHLPNKRVSHSWMVVEELPAWQALGPQGQEVAAIIEQAKGVTSYQVAPCHPQCAAGSSPWNLEQDAAWGAAWEATWDSAWSAARGAVWYAMSAKLPTIPVSAGDAAMAYAVRDLISPEDFHILADPWISVMGKPVLQLVKREG